MYEVTRRLLKWIEALSIDLSRQEIPVCDKISDKAVIQRSWIYAFTYLCQIAGSYDRFINSSNMSFHFTNSF